jgi:hypothetical protein
MAQEDDLYTDYALQLFASFASEDLATMASLIESFKDDDNNSDPFFMPGVIYGLMYHMMSIMKSVANQYDTTVENLLSIYAVDYAVAREDLLDSPLLNVRMVKENISNILAEIEKISDDDYFE